MAAAMNAGTWGAEGELLQQLHQVATAAQLTPEQHSVLLAASMPPAGAPTSMDAGYLEQLQQGAHPVRAPALSEAAGRGGVADSANGALQIIIERAADHGQVQ